MKKTLFALSLGLFLANSSFVYAGLINNKIFESKIGFGLGIANAVIGPNVEFILFETIGISGALGVSANNLDLNVWKLDYMCASCGIRYYILKSSESFCPTIGFFRTNGYFAYFHTGKYERVPWAYPTIGVQYRCSERVVLGIDLGYRILDLKEISNETQTISLPEPEIVPSISIAIKL